MKQIIALTTLLWSSFYCLGQDPIIFQDPLTKLYGYKNFAGEIVIKPVFHAGLPFTSGLAIVQEPVGGLAFPINPRGGEYGNDNLNPDGQKLMLGAIYGAMGGNTLNVKNPDTAPPKYNRLMFSYVYPSDRLAEVKNSALSLGKQEAKDQPPVITHKKSGMSYMHPYTLFDRSEHNDIIAYPMYFRMRIPFQFVGEAGKETAGFGYEFQFWYDNGGACSEVQHIAFLLENDNTLKIFNKRAKYADELVCGAWNCWNGKKKMEFHDFANYKTEGTFKPSDNGLNTLEIIRNKDEFFIYVNNQLLFRETMIDCGISYNQLPIPLFHNKGSYRFYAGSEYCIYETWKR